VRYSDELHPNFMRHGLPKYGLPNFFKTRELSFNNIFVCLFLGLFNKAWDV
jgi:hypothetical protein